MTERPCWVTCTPANAADNAWERLMAVAGRAAYGLPAAKRPSSLDDGKQALDHLIGSRHDLGVGRIGLLRHDQLAELRRDIDVRGLERASDDFAGRGVDRIAGLRRSSIGLAVERLQRVLTVESRQCDVRQGD